MVRVTIVIPVCNALEYLKKCLVSLVKYTQNYELIIIDNGSNKATKEYLIGRKKELGFKLQTNEKNMGFSYACNQGIKLAIADYICFLNSDTVLTPDWLGKLMEGFNQPDAGIVGPSTCWASSNQMIRALASRHNNMTLDEINTVKLDSGIVETELMGFCYLVSKKVIDKIGVFDYKRYGLGLSEEKDYNWRAKKAGFKLYWVKDVYIHHWGSKTFEEMGINQYKFLNQNKNILAKRIGEDSNIFIENDAVIDSIVTYSKKTDVIIPVLDRQKETTKTLNSLFENNKNINVIIIDNGSNDLSYLDEFDLSIVKNKENLGIIKAFNQGLSIAKSKYIVLMHNDIEINIENWIKKAISFMEENIDVGIVGVAGWKIILKNGNRSELVTAIDFHKAKPIGDFDEVAIIDGCCNVVKNIGLKFDEDYGYTHFYDLDLSMQYQEKGYRIFVINGNATHLSDERHPKYSTTQNVKYTTLINKRDSDYFVERKKIFIEKWQEFLPININQFQYLR